MLIFVIALLVFGPDRLPGMARQAGRYINQLRRLTQDARSEISSLTKELDIREDFNSVKADLMNIRDDLTSTAGGITKDFENIRKDITLRDTSGNTMGAQREQYTYEVKDAPAAAGSSSDAVIIEETIKRETIIQDAVKNTPSYATEVITSTTTSDATSVVDSSALPAEPTDPALRVIRPARPMGEVVAAGDGELAATASVVVESGYANGVTHSVSDNPFAEPYPESAEEAPKPVASNPFGTPFADAQPIENFLVPAEEAGPETKTEETAPVFSFAGTPAAQYAMATNGNGSSTKELEESLERTRQEFNERIEKMESQFIERLDRVEKLLASQFVRAHQEQGG